MDVAFLRNALTGPGKPDDEVVLAALRCQDTDIANMTMVYFDRHHAWMLKTQARRFLDDQLGRPGDQSEIEMVIGETMDIFTEKLKTTEPRGTIGAFLCEVIKNKCREYARRLRTAQKHKESLVTHFRAMKKDEEALPHMGRYDLGILLGWIMEGVRTMDVKAYTNKHGATWHPDRLRQMIVDDISGKAKAAFGSMKAALAENVDYQAWHDGGNHAMDPEHWHQLKRDNKGSPGLHAKLKQAMLRYSVLQRARITDSVADHFRPQLGS